MNQRFLPVFLLVFGFVLPCANAADRSLAHDLAVAPGMVLRVHLFLGAIRVEPSNDAQAHLVLTESAEDPDAAAAEKLLDDIDVRVEQGEKEVSVTARSRRKAHWVWQNPPSLNLNCVLRVPKGLRLDLTTLRGDIALGNHEGSVRLETESGAVFSGEIKGALEVKSKQGDVSVTACFGELIVTAKSGNILIGRAVGPAKLFAAGGLVEVQSARNQLVVEGNSADIRVAFAHPCSEAATLHASGGNIEVLFDQRSTVTVKAKSSRFAAVKTKNLPLDFAEGKEGASSIAATLNGGGPVVKIDASGGGVHLIGREP